MRSDGCLVDAPLVVVVVLLLRRLLLPPLARTSAVRQRASALASEGISRGGAVCALHSRSVGTTSLCALRLRRQPC
jgi:hypothetical protein